jgi:DNA-binding XRE family transcriptional regulator
MDSSATLRHIRKNVLQVTQQRLAEIAGVSQATVCRWEAGTLSPNLGEMALIRDEASRLGCDWNDGLFFAIPASTQNVQSVEAAS